jgi:hypothetical protein
MMDGELTLGLILLGTGGLPAAAIIRQVIELLKHAFPGIDSKISGAALAFLLSGGLYIFAYAVVAQGAYSAEGAFAAFLVWLSCATSAVGIHATLGHVKEARSPSE